MNIYRPRETRMAPAGTPMSGEFSSDWHDSLSWLLGTAMAAGADFAEIFLERTRQQTVNSRDGRISDCDALHTLGAGIRVARGMNTSYVSTTDLTLKGLDSGMAKALAAAGCGAGRISRWVQDIQFEPLRDYGRLRSKNDWHERQPGLEEMSERTLKLDNLIRSGVRHAQSTGTNFRSHWQEILVANTEGVFARDIRLTDFLWGNAICADGAHRFDATKTSGATGSPQWLPCSRRWRIRQKNQISTCFSESHSDSPLVLMRLSGMNQLYHIYKGTDAETVSDSMDN